MMMFYNCSSFNQELSSWNVSKVKYMTLMFYNCYKFNKPIGSWSGVFNVYNMSYMFSSCSSFNQPLSYSFIQTYLQSNENMYLTKPLIKFEQCPLTLQQLYRLQPHMKEKSKQLEKMIKEYYHYKNSSQLIINVKMYGFCKELVPQITSFCV